MSYARFSEGGVYVMLTQGSEEFNGKRLTLWCCACRLTPENGWFGNYYTESRTEMLTHLDEHKAAGAKVPNHTWKRLRQERKKHSDNVNEEEA